MNPCEAKSAGFIFPSLKCHCATSQIMYDSQSICHKRCIPTCHVLYVSEDGHGVGPKYVVLTVSCNSFLTISARRVAKTAAHSSSCDIVTSLIGASLDFPIINETLHAWSSLT